MEAFLAQLASLFTASGTPAGMLIAAVLIFAGQYLRKRLTAPAAPTTPAPDAPAGPSAPSNSPILDWLLKRLRERLAPAPKSPSVQTAAAAADIDPATAAAILKAIETTAPPK